MRILAIDTAMTGCAVGAFESVGQGSILELCAKEELSIERGQAEHLLPMINTVLKTASWSYEYIDLIAVTKGPGAFTGLRIGLATANSLGHALGIPVCGVSTLDATFSTYIENTQENKLSAYCAVLIETKRKDYYFAIYDVKARSFAEEPSCLYTQDISKVLERYQSCVLIGDAVSRFRAEHNTGEGNIKTLDISKQGVSEVALLGAQLYKGTRAGECAQPFYLRAPDVSHSKKEYRKIK